MQEEITDQANSTDLALENWLAEFWQARADAPEFYYNELAERAQAIGRLRPVLVNWLADRLSLAEFKSQATGEGRRQVKLSKGREAGRYWRFNGAGRLFLDSFFKAAERAGRLNAAGQALQAALTPPATLDRAGQQFEAFEFFVGDLVASGVAVGTALGRGYLPYLLSYFWAMQRPEWPIYDREIRTELTRLNLLIPAPKAEPLSPATAYTAFYLAFSRLGQQLNLNVWELESFLNWLARRDFSPARLLSASRKGRKRPANNKLEKLRVALEPRLKAALAAGLHGSTPEQERLIFQETDCPLRLELRLSQEQALAGVGFEGFNPAALSSSAGERVLDELRGFLLARPDYHFYDHAFNLAEPTPENLAEEFWLLRSLETSASRKTTAPDLPETLTWEWRSLYPFARRLIAPFEDVPDPSEPPSEAFSYPSPDSEDATRLVAETSTPYLIAPALPLEQDISPISPPQAQPQGIKNNEAELEAATLLAGNENRQPSMAEAEVQRLAHLLPAPLTAEQLDGLLVFVQERLVISGEKVREVLTHLEAGRNVLLYGPPGSGKTRLARLLAGQLCSLDPGWTSENAATNYSLATAGPEWSSYDVIGGIRPGLLSETAGRESDRLAYYFEPGVVARAALECERSLARNVRPHYLIIDEFNRANQERAFGQLFTVLEYRDQPLLPGARLGRLANLYLPDAFRLIGTMNSEDRNTLFELGTALRRRFALVELDLPPPAEEQRFLPRAVQTRLPDLKLSPTGEFDDPLLRHALEQLTVFAAAVRPDPANPAAGGKKLGTAPLIEALLFCAVAARFYGDSTEALEDAIMADLLPQLERAPQAIKRALAVVSPGGALAELARVRAALQRMSGTNTFF